MDKIKETKGYWKKAVIDPFEGLRTGKDVLTGKKKSGVIKDPKVIK